MFDPETLLISLFDAAVSAARTKGRLQPFLPDPPDARTIVVGAGKAGAEMAAAFEDVWSGQIEGLVVTRKGHMAPTSRIRVIEASHPVPDRASRDAATNILRLAQSAGPGDLLVCLLSGGASALLFAPLPGVPPEEKRRVTRELLACGATIDEFNCVRRHLSAIKGGRLALAAHPARIVTLAVSDVVGDPPEVIGSGPTVPDPSTQTHARAVFARYNIDPGPEIAQVLANPDNETPKPVDFTGLNHTFHLVASPSLSLAKASDLASADDIEVINLGDAIEGEARDFGETLARQAVELANENRARPVLILSGGELTVTVRNKQGRGGPNAECALGFAGAVGAADRIYGLFADTDGIDGSEDNAGAIVTPALIQHAGQLGLDMKTSLAENLSYDFFKRAGGLLKTGPTLTNINDFRAVLIMPAPA